MKISYDQATDSLYIHLADSASVDSEEVTAGVVLDYASTVLLDAKKQGLRPLEFRKTA